MARFVRYSEKENKMLIDDLLNQNNRISAYCMESLSELWPGFFDGLERKAYELYRHTILLAEQKGLAFNIDSIPKRDRSGEKKRVREKPVRSTKGRLHEQILFIVQNEMQQAAKKATAKILAFMQGMTQENIDLKEELRKARPYKGIVETQYQKELSLRGGG